MITQEIDLSLTDNLVPTVVHAKQYDHMGRMIKCSLYKEDVRYTIPEGTIVNVTGTRPDGGIFQYRSDSDPDIVFTEDNTVNIVVTNYMTAAFGRVAVDVFLISDEDESASTFAFTLRVEKAALNNAALSIGDYSGMLQKVMNGILSCSISEDGYLCFESDDSFDLDVSMNSSGVIRIDY